MRDARDEAAERGLLVLVDQLALRDAQLLGFYDPKRKTFFVEGKLSGEEADVTLFHEFVHALQDQHYDLSHLGDFEEDGGDRQSAVHGLAEGDATSAMIDAMLKPSGSTFSYDTKRCSSGASPH